MHNRGIKFLTLLHSTVLLIKFSVAFINIIINIKIVHLHEWKSKEDLKKYQTIVSGGICSLSSFSTRMNETSKAIHSCLLLRVDHFSQDQTYIL